MVTIRYKFRDLSLRHKLYISILLFIIIPLLVAGFLINYQFHDLTLRKSSEVALLTLKQASHNFNLLISDTYDISIRILSNGLVQQYVKFDSDVWDRVKMYQEIVSWLDDVVGSKTYFKSISLILGQTVIFQHGQYEPNVNEQHIEKAIKLNGEGYWTTSEDGVSYYRAIMDFNLFGNLISVERFNISERTLYGFYEHINAFEGSSIYLVDSDGRVLSSSDIGVVSKNLGNVEYINRALDMREGYFISEISGERYIILAYAIPDSNWHIIQEIPEQSFSMLRTTVNWILVIAIGLCVLFGIFFSFIQHAYLIKPLRKLYKEMNKVKSGNLDISLDLDHRDEIGEIYLGFIRMTENLKDMVNEVYISVIKQKEAELAALEAQINPHFLYNTLDSIRWLALKHKNYEVGEQIEALSEIFKHVLNKGEQSTTIAKELEFLENYYLLQKAKYGDRIKLQITVDSSLLEVKIPKMIIQPLVENALVHGLEPKIDGGTIDVRINRFGDDIIFEIQDDGVGANEAEINRMLDNKDHTKHVFALKNIDERIKLKYGSQYGLRFFSTLMIGTKVEVRLPLIPQ